jgi:putative hydrolase of the HAD superfamily
MIKAISFDIWDTLFIDDSDEIKRQELNLPSKSRARIDVILDEAEKMGSQISFDQISMAYTENLQEFNQKWQTKYVTELVPQRIAAICKKLNLRLPQASISHISKTWEEMELNISPDLVPEVDNTLKGLAQAYRLAIVSDAVVSSGRVLRQILQKLRLHPYFEVFIFSDEIGASKPSERIFRALLSELALPANQVVHIGDRPSNDVMGAQRCGIKAILYDEIKKRDIDKECRPDAICHHFLRLPELIKQL